MKWLVLFTVLVISFKDAHPYFVTVDSYSEECFFEKADVGSKMGLSFEIADGGFLDIKVKIVDPNNVVLYDKEHNSGAKLTFPASYNGPYTYCFNNNVGSMVPKLIMFNMEVTESPQQRAEEHAKQPNGTDHKLDDMIKELGTVLFSVKNEQEYMGVRDRIHREINENTNNRVVTWSLFESILMLGLSIGQVYYLKRFFEVRAVV